MSNRNSHPSTGGQQHSLVVANNEAPNSVISSFIRAHIESSPDPNHLDYSQVFSCSVLKEFRLQMNKKKTHNPNMTQHTTFLIFYSIRLVPMILIQKIVFYPQVAQEMIQTQALPLES